MTHLGSASVIAMRAALERVEALARPASIVNRSAFVPIGLAAGLAGLAAAAVFAGGGSDDDSLFWVGGAAVFLAAVAGAAGLMGVLPLPQLSRTGWISVALFVLFLLWTGMSVLWSLEPARSWSYFNRGVAYLAFLLVGLFAGALVRRAPVVAARGFALLVGAALVWALAGKIFPALHEDGGRVARLREPIGYWNSLALLFAMALPVALSLAADARPRRTVRVLRAVLYFGLVVGVLLTFSRAGTLVGVVAVVAWCLVERRRLLSAAPALVGASVVALGLAAWAFVQPGISSDRQAYDVRVQDGAELAIALVLGAALVTGLVLAAEKLPAPSAPFRSRLRRGGVALGVVVAVAALAVLAVRRGDAAAWVERQADEFRNPPNELVVHDPSRFRSASSNNRWDWWQESWRSFRSEPLLGTGAGTFESVHKQMRTVPLTVIEPHNEPLQFLGELGLVGFLLGVGAAVTGFAAAVANVRRLGGAERAAGAALAVGLGAYLLHSVVDWHWDFLAVSGPALVLFGILLAAGRPAGPASRGLLWAGGVALLGAITLASFASPWLAERRAEATYESLAGGEAEKALAQAESAGSLNPLALEPLVAEADARVALGDVPGARHALVVAVDRFPRSGDAWYELGWFEYEIAGRPVAALPYLYQAQQLDRVGPVAFLLPEVQAAAAAAGS